MVSEPPLPDLICHYHPPTQCWRHHSQNPSSTLENPNPISRNPSSTPKKTLNQSLCKPWNLNRALNPQNQSPYEPESSESSIVNHRNPLAINFRPLLPTEIDYPVTFDPYDTHTTQILTHSTLILLENHYQVISGDRNCFLNDFWPSQVLSEQIFWYLGQFMR